MADRIVQFILILTLLYFAANNWHTYISEKRHEKDGWFCLMAALATTIGAAYIWFN